MENHTTSPPKMQAALKVIRLALVCGHLEGDGLTVDQAKYEGGSCYVHLVKPIDLYSWAESHGYEPKLVKRTGAVLFPAILSVAVDGVEISALCDKKETEFLTTIHGGIQDAEAESKA